MTHQTERSANATQASYIITEPKVAPKHFYLGRTTTGFWISADAKQRARDFTYLKNSKKSYKTFIDFCYMLGMISRRELTVLGSPKLQSEIL